MSQLFIAQQLNQLLSYWEDCNLSGEYMFQLNLAKNRIRTGDEDLETLMGSELNKKGFFARSINGYENLRKVLSGRPHVHDTNFMPRIPKNIRDLFQNNYASFIDSGFAKYPVTIPNYLLKWNENRRACVVEDSIPVPMVNLNQENWLEKLPYESFFLELESPFVFQDSDSHQEWNISSFLIYKDGDYTRIMLWPREIDRMLMTDEDRKRIKFGIAELKKGRVPKKEKEKEAYTISASKVHDWFLSSVSILKGTSLILGTVANHNSPYMDIYDKEAWGITNQNIPNFYATMKTMMEVINGFCKLMATLPGRQTVKVTQVPDSNTAPIPPRDWFELPLQTVEYFHTYKENNVIFLSTGSGSEKSPHIRRGHTRRIVKKDGSITEIWIAQSVIRADKLVTEQLQGGALKIE